MNGSYFIPKEKMAGFLKGMEMNNQEGIFLYGNAHPRVKELLPEPLELADHQNPLLYLYIVNIREPSFAPWYMEGGIGVLAKHGDKTGIYFFSLMLNGPGALMGAFKGREGFGLPKKLCERIVVERTDKHAQCYIERKGVRLVEVELELGSYNDPSCHLGAEGCEAVAGGLVSEDGGCFLHKYQMRDEEFTDLELVFYDSPTRYRSWEPATATVKLASSIDDPWGEIPLVTVLGAGWSVCDNWVKATSVLYRYPQEEAANAMQYLFAGRYDRCLASEQRLDNFRQ